MSREFKLSKAELVLRKKTTSAASLDYGPNVHAAHRECDECMRKNTCGSKAGRNLSAGIQATLDMAKALLRIANLKF